MTLRASIIAAFVVALGCESEPDSSFRDAPIPGDGDLTIYLGPDTASPDIIIYDVKNGFVYQGQASSDNLILNVHDGEILNATNTEVFCAFDGNQLVDAESGEVVLTTHGKVIFDGDGGGPPRFWLQHDQIFEGAPVANDPLATATEDIAMSTPMRKLLIGALMSENCGAPSLPERQ